jgi:hypothetical protein
MCPGTKTSGAYFMYEGGIKIIKYVFTFSEINYGRIQIEADRKPDNGELIEKILEGKADYSDTDFTNFRLIAEQIQRKC